MPVLACYDDFEDDLRRRHCEVIGTRRVRSHCKPREGQLAAKTRSPHLPAPVPHAAASMPANVPAVSNPGLSNVIYATP